jgi:hypothetical protein
MSCTCTKNTLTCLSKWQNERWTLPADSHNITGQFDPSVHGFDGINSVSLPGFLNPIDQRVIQTTRDLSGEFPYNIDTNSGHHLGIGAFLNVLKDSTTHVPFRVDAVNY